MIEVRVKDTVVRSDDLAATLKEAEAFASVLSENWLEGAPQDEPLRVEATRTDGCVVQYTVTIEPAN
jgi:hypothetical protein